MSEKPPEQNAVDQKPQRKIRLSTAVLIALIAPLATITGTLIANKSQSDILDKQLANERSERLADLRREAYSDLVLASLDLLDTFSCYAGIPSTCSNTTSGTLTKEELTRDIAPRMKVFSQKAAEVALLGTKDSIRAAFALSDSFPAPEPIPSKARLKKTLKVTADKFDLFLNTIRSELGLSPI
jgi:hypothetical protein